MTQLAESFRVIKLQSGEGRSEVSYLSIISDISVEDMNVGHFSLRMLSQFNDDAAAVSGLLFEVAKGQHDRRDHRVVGAVEKELPIFSS
mgnify:CR=1 FL=1